MKIIQLIYSLKSGGAEKFVVSLSNALAMRDHDVTVCMLLSSDKTEYIFNRQFLLPDVKFVTMNFDQGFSIKKKKVVENFIESERPDVVHCHLNVLPYIFNTAIKCRTIKFVHTLHNIANKASGHILQKLINKWFYKNGIITPVTISDQCNLSYKKFYSLDNAYCIYNGCDIPMKSSNYEQVYNEIESYKTTNDTKVFVHVARYHAQKNQQLLINAFNRFKLLNKDYILLVIGEGFDKGTGLDLVKSSMPNIHYLGLKPNVVDYLYLANAFCLTSIYEGLPISLLESLACGVTPICTSVGGIPDVITDGVNGYLSYDVSIESYMEAIERYDSANNEIKRSDLTNYFREKYSIDSCVTHYLMIYEKRS